MLKIVCYANNATSYDLISKCTNTWGAKAGALVADLLFQISVLFYLLIMIRCFNEVVPGADRLREIFFMIKTIKA